MCLAFSRLLAFSILLAACAVGGADEPAPDDMQADPVEEDGDERAPVEAPDDFTTASFGVTALSEPGGWSLLIAAVSEPGIVGCALTQDGAGAPVGATERIRVKLDVGVQGANSLCPAGTYALRNDPACAADTLLAGCAVYERWNDDGTPDAPAAAAGAVEVREGLDENGFAAGCTIELDLRFAGGVRFAHSFELAVDRFSGDSSTCVHDALR